MAYHHIDSRRLSLLLVFAIFWETSFGWRWKTSDAIIQDVWPEESSLKLKRASARSIDSGRGKVEPAKAMEDLEDDLVFEGHYFKPNEVSLPPPPPFMVDDNWRGSSPPETKDEEKHLHTLYKQQRPSSYFVVGVGPGEAPPLPPPLLPSSPPISVKFTSDNVKILGDLSNGNSTAEEKVHSSSNSNPKTVAFSNSSPLERPPIEEAPYFEEQDLAMLEIFRDAPKCYTPTDTEGRCIEFRQCFPVAFNVIDGDLRNPGLARLLYQASGPCNATLEFEFALRKLNDEKAFLKANFYNQSVCCPGFKYPPESLIKPWPYEVRSARLILSDDKDKQASASDTLATATINHSTNSPDEKDVNNSNNSKSGLDNSKTPLAVDESSVEVPEVEADTEEMEYTTLRYQSQDDPEEEELTGGGEEFGEIVIYENLNATVREDTTETVELEKEERRGDREKFYGEKVAKGPKSKVDAFAAIPAPHLAPNTCRQQIYGMPRGHWPWMVALVISSRHICSGALVSERAIVTAAHCVYLLSEADVKKLRIIIGDRVMYSSVDGPHFWRKVTKIITHANYNQQTFSSDIAILKLNSAVPFSRNVQPISLPESTSLDTSLLYGKGIVAGWSGADIGQPAFEARTEVETVVDIMDKMECRETYRGFALSGLAANTFCTKPQNNTCVADSGAPLIVRSQNCWLLQGIMSWGIGCTHFPEVFTDVSRYTTWIRKHLN